MKNKTQIRQRHFIESVQAEFRTTEKDGQRFIEGYAAVFDVPADIAGIFTEYVRKGSFTKTIMENDIRALFNHNPDYVLGRNKAETLVLEQDSKGLFFRASAPDTTYANDLIESIKRNDVSQCSFGFRTIKDNWFTEKVTLEGGKQAERDARELLEVKLYDVSPVTYSAYEETTVSARDLFSIEGLDLDRVSKLVFRAENGLALRDEDREYLNSTIRSLSRYLPEEPPADGGHSSPEGQPAELSVTLLRAKLDVMERGGLKIFGG